MNALFRRAVPAVAAGLAAAAGAIELPVAAPGLSAPAAASAESAAAVPAAASPDAAAAGGYGWLDPSTLPAPGPLLQAALEALPASVAGRKDWAGRMRRATWVPTLELRYGVAEGVYRPYETVIGSTGGSAPQEPRSLARTEQTQWLNEYGLYLTWDLSGMVFRREEVDAAARELDRETYRGSVREQVIQTYYDLKEALLLLETDAYRDSVPTLVRKERLAFLLDTLCDGALTAGRPAPRPPEDRRRLPAGP